VVNFAATTAALWEFWNARTGGQELAWHKTDHVYPLAPVPALATTAVGFHPLADASANAVAGESY
jgi:hypothetical protein